MAEGGWGELGDAGVVEVGEPFGAREFGLVDQSDAAAGVSFVAFGGSAEVSDLLCKQWLPSLRGHCYDHDHDR
jgi:hypothetical protein